MYVPNLLIDLSAMLDRPKGLLRIRIKKTVSVEEAAILLMAIDNAYNNLIALTRLVERAGNSKGQRVHRIAPIVNVKDVISPDELLILNKVVIQSPGFLEFLGSLNPLDQIRKYMKERHERNKDFEYRNRLEEEKLSLQNQSTNLENVKKQVEILKSLDVPDESIIRALNRHVHTPLKKLYFFQDSGVIEAEEADIVKEESEFGSTTKSTNTNVENIDYEVID